MRSHLVEALPMRSWSAVAAVAVLALLATGSSCATSPEGTSSPSPSISAPEPTPSPSAVTTLPAEPAEHVELGQVEIGRVPLQGGGGPDWMAAGFGSLWVRKDNAVVVRLAPDGSVEASIDAGIWRQPVCQGLGISDTAVWACATSGKLMRIDPRTNEVAAIVDVPKVNDQGRLVSYDGRIWVLTGAGDQLVGVSEATNEPGPPIDLGASCTDVSDTVVGTSLWVACSSDGVVLRVDLRAGEVTGRVGGLTHPAAVAAGPGVWVCTDDGVAQVDESSLGITALQPAAGGLYCSLRLIDGDLWVRTPTSYLTRIDTTSGGVAAVITAPGPSSGGDVIEFGDALWVSAYDLGLVFTLSRLLP